VTPELRGKILRNQIREAGNTDAISEKEARNFIKKNIVIVFGFQRVIKFDNG